MKNIIEANLQTNGKGYIFTEIDIRYVEKENGEIRINSCNDRDLPDNLIGKLDISLQVQNNNGNAGARTKHYTFPKVKLISSSFILNKTDSTFWYTFKIK